MRLFRTKPRKTASPETLQAIPAGTVYHLEQRKDGTFKPVFDLAIDQGLQHGKGKVIIGEADQDFVDDLRMMAIRNENERRGIRVAGFRTFDGQLA
jgi:hypothetical protein